MNYFIKYLTIPVAVLLSGCASSLTSPVPGGKVTYNKSQSNAYVIFSRPEYIGAALTNTIVEFNPSTYTTQLVGILGPNNKLVYRTTPGTHYFYMDGGENDDMIKVNTKSSMEYYVHTAVSMGIMVGRFYFRPIRYPSVAIAGSLKGKTCDTETLSKYKFKIVKDDASDITGEIKYHSAQHSINIECRKGTIKRAKYKGESLESINDATLVQSNDKAVIYYNEHKANYIKEIKEDFADWKNDDMQKTALKPNDGRALN